MPIIHRTAIVPFSASQMFDLVNDVEAYPEFLTWCTRAVIIGSDVDELTATLTLSRSGVTKEFTTHNRMQTNKIIEIRLVNGPFKHLQGLWRFDALSEHECEVSLDLEFEFINRIVGFALEPVFHPIANTLVDAFCERAQQKYQDAGESHD